MIHFKCNEKNLVVLVRLKEHGKATVKHIRFDEKGALSLSEEGATNQKIIEKLRALCGTNRIKGLKETGGKKNDRKTGVKKSTATDGQGK